MGDVSIDGVSWSMDTVPWIPFDQFVKESDWAYKKYSEQDRLTLLKIAYSYIHGEGISNEQSNGSVGDIAGA
jgi:hypothetical protein